MARLEDFLLTEGLPEPLNHLKHSLDTNEEFTDGARKCARFFIAFEDRFRVDELLRKFMEPCVPARWLEYVLFCFLDVGYPYLQIAQQALRLKCLRRVMMRQEAGTPLDEQEQLLAAELKSMAGIEQIPDLLSWAYRARELVVNAVKGTQVDPRQRAAIVYLIRAEVIALKQRIARISENVDVYDLRQMARVLPSVRTFDENAHDALGLALAFEQGTMLRKRSLTFEDAIKSGSFDKWLAPLAEDPELALLHKAFTVQREKLVPSRSLVALASLHRWIGEATHAKLTPIEWISRSLETHTQDKFSIDAGPAIDSIRDFVTNSGAWIDGTTVSGSFSDRLYTQWIGHDMLTRPYRQDTEEQVESIQSYREIICSHFFNDKLMDRLLDISRVYETSGLVEYIARRSRSVKVLTKIATRNFLYAGSANGGVPRALLKNPSPIPMDLLRVFLKRSFFSPPQLRAILTEGELRPEVVSELKAFIASQ